MRTSRFAAWCVCVVLVVLGSSAFAADFTLSPTSLSFGNQVINTSSAAKTITLTNTSGAAFNLIETVSAPYGVSDACAGHVAAGGTCVISVTFSPTVVGATPLTLKVTDLNTSSFINVSLSGTGVAPTTLAPISLSFGSVALNTASVAKTFKLTNNQSVALNSIVLTSNNPDYVVTGCPATLPAGGFCTASVTFTPSASGADAGAITVTDDAPSSGQTLPLSGVGVAATTLSTTAVGFGSVVTNTTSAPKTFKLTNNQSVALNSIVITSNKPEYVVTGCPASLPALGSCTASVTFTPVAMGADPATLTVTHDVPATSGQPVTATGTGVAGITLTPATGTYSTQGLATTSAPKTFTLKNNETFPLNTITVTTTGDYAATGCAAPLAAGASCVISVTFTPTSLSPPTRTGTLTVTAPDAAAFSPASVQLTGTAGTPVTVSPVVYNFGNQTVGSTSTGRVFNIKNNQSQVLNFAAPAFVLTGDFALSAVPTATPCGATLAPLATCSILLTFHPTLGGSRSGTLSVNSDAVNSPVVVNLSGNGTTPITITPLSVPFGNVSVGLVSPIKVVTLKNNQSVAANISSIAASGDFAISSQTCASVLAAGTTCTVSLTSSPTVGGTRTGSLVIVDDTTGSPHAVPLTATGTNAVTELPTGLTFATQLIGTTSIAKTITLVNHQTVPVSFTTTPSGDFSATNNCSDNMPPNSTCVVAATFSPTMIGIEQGSLVFGFTINGAPASLTAKLTGTGTATPPPATVASISPGAGTAGTSVDVIISGRNTHFSNSSVVTFAPIGSSPSGITVSNVTTTQASCPLTIPAGALCAHFAIDPGAVPGARNVTVKTPLGGGLTESASLSAAFVVSTSSGLTFSSITPSAGTQGWTGNVELIASGSHFQQGLTIANFGDGISVNGALTVHSATDVGANITISPTAGVGPRTVTLVTGGEFVTSGPQGFVVTLANEALVSVNPNTTQQGTILTGVVITGSNTHFLQNATQVTFGSGVTVGNTHVLSPTSVQLDLSVADNAPVGVSNVTVATGGEIESLANGFIVAPSTSIPYLSSITPTSAVQGQTGLAISITGVYTNFDPATTTLEIGSDVTVHPLTVTPTTVNGVIDVATFAQVGGRQAILKSGGINFPFTFVIYPSAASIASISPSGAPQGASPTLTVTGSNTHWDQATTNAWFSPNPYCAVPTVNRVTINSATSAALDTTIPLGGCIGPQTLVMSTGGEVVTGAFTVYANTPSVIVSPSNSLAGKTITVNFTGDFTHFADGTSANPTTINVDGVGVNVVANSFTVTSSVTATAQFVIDPAAPITPPVSPRTVTLTTALGSGKNEIVKTSFAVTNNPAVLLAISPYDTAPGTTLSVEITGANTHFTQGTTTVGLGPNITVNNITVNSLTDLVANITVDNLAALGWRNVYVNTGAEQLTIGFRIDGPASATAINIDPASGAQGQSLAVNITGLNTHWVQGTTSAIVGAGVTVADLVIVDATHATATLAISPTAPVGSNSVIMFTGTEIASGTGFSVTPGVSQITQVQPNIGTQNQTLSVLLVGQGTHWLQGGTVANFGPAIAVDQLTIDDATHAHAQITVLSTATVGFRTVSMTTDGEFSSMVQAFDVVQGTPTLLSSTPNAGMQGTTFNVQVLGRLTHWQTGVTTASYGDGATVNSFTALDSTSGIMNVSIDPLAYPDVSICHKLTVTTGTEQVSLTNQLCIQPGAAVVTNVNPNASPQSSTLTVAVTGLNTHWVQGLTTANFGSGINAGNVIVTSPTAATVDLAVTTSAPNGFHDVTLRTLGETAFLQYGFVVGPTTPTLNGVSPVIGQQGQHLTVHIIGQYTHFAQGVTTATVGQGITLNSLTVTSPTGVDADITIDPLAFVGGRTFALTTGGEIVSGNLFSVIQGPAIISDVTPTNGNQGQEKVLQITGTSTHWAQGFTQFSMSGLGYDLKVNYFVINSPTSATADITISPTASLGVRSVYMVTGGEALTDNNAFVVTGGIPSIISVSPGTAKPGDTSVNVQITGVYTKWLTGTVSLDFGPGITVETANTTVNSDTSITAVVDIDPAAQLGYRTVTVRDGGQALTGSFQVVNPLPPTPYISWMWPSNGLPGQTFTITIVGQYTHWDPVNTQILFNGTGVTVNTFQVTSPNTARVNITIDPAATASTQQIEITTGTELETVGFSTVIAVPVISIVDPYSGMQGATLDVNVVGQYTTFDNTTVFNFGPGITVNTVTILGPTIAKVNVTIGQLTTLGGHYFTATTGTQVVASYFSVTPSQAVITSPLSPNTGKQGDTIVINVTGLNTHWDNTTTFSFGGGVAVTTVNVTSATTATVTVSIAPLATVGGYSITAQTQGEIASLNNAFIVQPGTPLLLSSGPGSGQQQQNVTLTILSQFTNWVQGSTTVDLGSGVTVTNVTVTSPTAMTVNATVQPTAYQGYRNVTVTSGAQVLSLPYAFYVTAGPAAISLLNPAQAGQGHTLDVVVTGTNTNFQQGVTVASFGPGISVNTVNVTSPTSATVNITIGAFATPGLNTVTVNTLGESASAPSAFTIVADTSVLTFVSPASGVQGATQNVNVIAQFTNFDNTTVFNFGAGITVNNATINTPTSATVNITIAPTAALGLRNVTATTGAQVAGGQNLFTVNAGPAYLSAVTPHTGQQNQNGLQIVITGFQTHFTAATPVVNLGAGVNVTAVQVNSDTQITITVNISQSAPVQTNNVSVTTGGEVAAFAGGFQVTPGAPFVNSISPTSAHDGDTLNVTVFGVFTNFVQGTTTASFGSGVTVNSVTVNNSTQATVNITLQPAATLGTRNVTMTTGTEVATGANLFTLLSGSPQIQTVSPNTGAQGSTQTVTITGLFTNFQQGVSTVSFSGNGVTTGSVTVNGPTQIQVPVTVTLGATAGARTVTVTTGGEVASLSNAFTVQPGTPSITVIGPNVGVPNSSISVSITGQFTNFVNGVTQANFGAGISVNGGALGATGTIVVTSPTTATASLTIDPAAALGPRNVTISTNAEVLIVNSGFTVQSSSPSAPSITTFSPNSNATGVPTNTSVTIQFSAPIDRTTVNTGNVRLVDPTADGYCYNYPYTAAEPATVSVDASGRVVTLTPSAVLKVGRQYQLCVNYGQQGTPQSIKDPSANQISQTYMFFTTGFAPDNSGPAFVAANIADGDNTVPTNVSVTLGFTKPIDPVTVPAGLTITNAGIPVPGTFGYTPDHTQITFTPASPFAATTQYVVTYTAALNDSVGNALSNPGTITFTTQAGPDSSAPQFQNWNPVSNTVTGTTPVIEATFDTPLDALRANTSNFYLYDYATGLYVYGTSVTLSPDRKKITLNLARPLDPGTQYSWTLYAYGRSENYSYGSASFTTSTGPDTLLPAVQSISPSAGATNVAVNAKIQVLMNEVIDRTVGPIVTLTPAVPFTYALASDNRTLTFTPTSALATATLYTFSISGVTDADGNVMAAPYSWSFTTSASSTPDTTSGTMSMVPGSGATNVAVTAQIVLSLSKPVNPNTVNGSSFRVYDSTAGAYLPGSITISADDRTVTFTPSGPLQGNHSICAYASYYAYMYDWAGNNFNYVAQCFTTTAAVDSTPPQVIAVAPLNNATGIGRYNPVTVTFSKPMSPPSLNSGNVALFTGSTLVTNGASLSSDSTSITFNATLSYGTVYTVVISPNVMDLAGNHLAAQFTSTFTTAPYPATSRPQVIAFQPGQGVSNVDPHNPITFYLSQPIDPTTVNAALYISQDGVLITGSTSVLDNNQVVTFTPSVPFHAGSLEQVWFTSAAKDTFGNLLYDYQTSFTIAPDLSTTAPTLLSYFPAYNSGLPLNTVVDVRMSKSIDPTTVTAASFYLTDCSSNPISTSISMFNNNTVLRLTPTSPLPANGCFYYYLTNAIKDVNSIAFAGANPYFYTGTATDTVQPAVVAITPMNGAVNIGVNSKVRVVFNKAIATDTVDAQTLTLSSSGNPIPYSFSTTQNGDGTMQVTLTPQMPLPASAQVTVGVTSGVTDSVGQGATPSSVTFTTAAGANFSNPSVVASNFSSGDVVPVTSVFTLTFDRPMDTRTFAYGNNIYMSDQYAGGYVPVTLTFSPDGTQVTLAPNSPLAVNRSYYIYSCCELDLTGNSANGFGISFSTQLYAPVGGPQVVLTVPYNNATNIPDNFIPEVKFDRSVAESSFGNVTLTTGGSPVTYVPSFQNADTMVRLIPNSILQPNTDYVLTITGVTDAAGTAMAGPVVVHFHTAPSIDLGSTPTVINYTPLSNSTTGTNPVIRFVFNEPIDVIRSNGFYLYNYGEGQYEPGVTFSFDPTWTVATLSYPGPLDPNSYYEVCTNTLYNLAGAAGSFCVSFYTGSGTDTTPLVVLNTTPPSGAVGLPLNPVISVKLNKPVDPTSYTGAGISLTPAAAGTVQASTDGMTLTYALSSNLAPSTLYTLHVNGFSDLDGNPVTPYTGTFTTATVADTTSGTIAMTSPAPGALGVDVNSTITLTLSKPVNPLSVLPDSFVVQAGNTRLAGTITISANGGTLTFTPLSPLPASQTINVYGSYFGYIRDLAGNNFNYVATSFSTAATADTTPPTVVSVTPGNNATNVGPYSNVVILFSKSLNPSTINNSNFALYSGYTNLNAGVSHSPDYRMVTLNRTLPYGSTITVSIGTGVQDLSGNALAASYRSTFTTLPPEFINRPNVTQMRPSAGATGIPVNSVITLYSSAPMNASTISGALAVVQNGSVIPGNTVVDPDGYSLVFTPTSPFAASALVQVFLNTSATDVEGNSFNSYSGAFYTAADLTLSPLTITANSPCWGCSNAPLNTVVDVQFNKPIDPAFATGTYVTFADSSQNPLPATVTQVQPNVLRITPTAALSPSVYYYYWVSGSIKAVDGSTLGADSAHYYFYAGTTTDTLAPSVTQFAPTNGATNIGDNASIRFRFNKHMDEFTLSPSTITVQSGGNSLPFSMSFNEANNITTVTLLTRAPLPDNAAVTLSLSSGISDLVGQSIAPQSITFNTMSGPDTVGPYVVSRSIDNSISNVPVNTRVFTFVFNKPVDPMSINSGNEFVYSYSLGTLPGAVTLGADGRTVTITESANLAASTQHYYCAYNPVDLTGNAGTNECDYFVTSAATSATGPQVIASNPLSAATGVATNANVEVVFDRRVDGTTLGQITLKAGASSVPFSMAWNTNYTSNGLSGTVLRLVPANLLQPNTTYTVTVTGVTDLAGNAMGSSYSFSFTTGPNTFDGTLSYLNSYVNLSGVQTQLIPYTNVSGADPGTPITVTFNGPVDIASIMNGGVRLLVSSTSTYVPTSVTLSPDGMTATVTPLAPLNLSTQYLLYVNYSYAVYDTVGRGINYGYYYYFTTSATMNLQYTLTGGGDTITFQVPQIPTPVAALDGSCFGAGSLPITINGSTAPSGVEFCPSTTNGGLAIYNGSTYVVNQGGPQLFTGTLGSPTLTMGTYSLTTVSGAPGTYNHAFQLVVTAAP